MSARQYPEFQMQVALFNWAELFMRKYPPLKWMKGSMNGVQLTKAQAGKAKAAGMKKGEHDITLTVSRGGYAGLSIELKSGANKPTKEQLEYGEWLIQQGWRVEYCWDHWDKAAAIIQDYLDGKLVKP